MVRIFDLFTSFVRAMFVYSSVQYILQAERVHTG